MQGRRQVRDIRFPAGVEPTGAPGISARMRQDMQAAMAALPNTDPTWRLVL